MYSFHNEKILHETIKYLIGLGFLEKKYSLLVNPSTKIQNFFFQKPELLKNLLNALQWKFNKLHTCLTIGRPA